MRDLTSSLPYIHTSLHSRISVRSYPDRPIVGVGAVVFDGDRVLLVKRAREPLKGQWSLPGGAVHVGETLTQAIAREVKEETGLDVEVGPVVEVLERIHRDPSGRVEYHYVLVDYLCQPANGTLAAASDAEAAAWVRVDALDSYGVAEVTMAVIRKGLAEAGGWR